MIKTFSEMRQLAAEQGLNKIAVVCAEDDETLLSVETARKEGLAEAVLIGNVKRIQEIAGEENIDLQNYECIDIADNYQAALKGGQLVSEGKAQILMKGMLETPTILKAVLHKEVGLVKANVLSHVGVLEVERYPKLLMITDAGMNFAPDVGRKKQIIENSLDVATALHIDTPYVGVVCAVNKVTPKMQATLDAKKLIEMNQNGEIKGCVVSGPFGFDNAVSKETAKIKNVNHPGAGKCDILLMHNLDAGNALYKALKFFAGAQSAGVIVGAKAPVILTSRADSKNDKLNAIALAALL